MGTPLPRRYRVVASSDLTALSAVVLKRNAPDQEGCPSILSAARNGQVLSAGQAGGPAFLDNGVSTAAPSGAVALSVDGTRLLYSFPDRRLGVGAVESAEPLWTRTVHQGSLGGGGRALSPDGRVVVSVGGDPEVAVALRADDGEVVWRWGHAARHPDRDLAIDEAVVAFSESGLLAIGGEDGAIKWVDPETGRVRLRREAHVGGPGLGVSVIRWSRDGSVLLSGGRDRFLRAWHGPTGRLLWEIRNEYVWVRLVGFSHDGKRVLFGGDDGLEVRCSRTGEELDRIDFPERWGSLHGVICPDDAGFLLAVESGELLQYSWSP